jgi:formyltetrahydrofolate synthetase
MGYENLDKLILEKYKAEQPVAGRPTAAAQNYASLQEIRKTGTDEDIALAEKVFAGINAGKTETQTLQATAASLAKTVNPITQELYTPEEIQAQLDNLKNIFKQFSMPKTEDIIDDKKVMTVGGFQVEEI